MACISDYFIGLIAGLYRSQFGLLIMNVNLFITATAIISILLMPIVLYKKYFKEGSYAILLHSMIYDEFSL